MGVSPHDIANNGQEGFCRLTLVDIYVDALHSLWKISRIKNYGHIWFNSFHLFDKVRACRAPYNVVCDDAANGGLPKRLQGIFGVGYANHVVTAVLQDCLSQTKMIDFIFNA
jgi:hypothetical protein